MNHTKLKSVTTLTLVLIILAGLMAGCGGGDTPSAATTPPAAASSGGTSASAAAQATPGSAQPSGEITTITIYPPDATAPSGVTAGFIGDIYEKRGLRIEIWAFSDEKTNAILASGDLPDIMYTNYKNLQAMIHSNMVLNLEEHLPNIPHVANDENIQAALSYARMFRSNDTNSIYGIPALISIPSEGEDTGRNATKVNWPVYYDLGCPEIKTVDDLIPLMKQMMEHKPTAEDGTKTWGTVLNAGTDGQYWRSIEIYYKWFGYEMDNLAYLIETDMLGEKYTNILETGRNTKYYEGLQFYNKCFREGVLDPDSINNDRETQKAKVETSRAVMVPSGSTPGWAGYKPIMLEGQKIFAESWGSPYGVDTFITISAKSPNVDACLTFLDMFADGDVRFELRNGTEAQGKWETGADGNIHISDYGFEMMEAGLRGEQTTYINGEKGDVWLDRPIIVSSHASTYSGTEGLRLIDMNRWPEFDEIRNSAEDVQQWRETFKYPDFTSLLKANNAYTLFSGLQYVAGFCPNPDDNTQLLIDAIRDVVVAASWKMVYTESDTEFEALWDRMIKDCEDLGAADIVQWRLDELAKGKQVKDSLSK